MNDSKGSGKPWSCFVFKGQDSRTCMRALFARGLPISPPLAYIYIT